MQGLLQDKVAMVTGGGSGIGEATAMTFHKDGAKVAIIDRNIEEAERVRNAITEDGGDAIALHANVAQDEEVANAIAMIVEEYGALHAASNNAAFGGGFKGITEFSEKEWGLINDVTLKGVWLCMKHQLMAMEASGGGAIVNISSVGGIRGESKMSLYSAAKGGVIALTKTAAAEYGQRGVRVNCVAPGGVMTAGMKGYFDALPEERDATIATHAMRRLGEPYEIADAVSYLLSDRASFITGAVLTVDGGIMVNPHNL
ncbi:MAG: SDR family oxidoreductase [Halioglobus sp.]|nr:SDR family oxidoreductase [Halioglobus sp.]